ncbi:hypothetical protein CEXT_506661 [Caerostris extrusa]|uniref:Uncharacterized protein n=1 Tax=Caerostris extrusa TaxID=172846 RepID=A0AAV4MUA9_CAEEX|nr:hypothetical protein CEXT_506661 [Caerostris extrusa]
MTSKPPWFGATKPYFPSLVHAPFQRLIPLTILFDSMSIIHDESELTITTAEDFPGKGVTGTESQHLHPTKVFCTGKYPFAAVNQYAFLIWFHAHET